MKKKIVASVAAFALALAMPMSAFAAGSIEAQKVPGMPGTQIIEDCEDVTDGAVTDIVLKGKMGNVYVAPAAGAADAAEQVASSSCEADLAKLAKNEWKYTPEQYRQEVSKIEYKWNKAVADYMNTVNQFDDLAGNNIISTFVLNGDNEGPVTVTLALDPYFQNHTVTAVILHADGTIQTEVIKVGADGLMKLEMDGFSAFTLIDTYVLPDGYSVNGENTATPANKDTANTATSPKTGC